MKAMAGLRTILRTLSTRVRFLGAAVAAAALVTACSGSAAVPVLGRVEIDLGGRSAAASATPSPAPAVRIDSTALPAATGSGSAADLQAALVQVVKTAGASVVQVETPDGQGSGVVFDAAGDIVTNAHVVAGADSFRVTTPAGAQFAARLVGSDPARDLAVIRVTSGSGLVPATFGDSARLQVGDIVVAIGSPYGLQGSVTQGLVSALNRDVRESRQVTLSGLIQTSAPINPGNSGGALTDIQGRVVGIPTLGAVGGDGIGFAIPSDTVVAVARRLIAGAAAS